MVSDPGLARAYLVLFLAPAAQGDQEHAAPPALATDALGKLVAVDVGHAEIEDGDVRTELGTDRERALAVVGRAHLLAAQPQQLRERLRRVLVVVDDEDAPQAARRRGARALARPALERGLDHEGQAHDEGAALAEPLAPRLDRAAVDLDQVLRERETEPETAARVVGRPVDLHE